jgi:hypothetical protein
MSRQNIINLIYQIAPKYGADPRLMAAVAQVESGFNPGAVGDNGSSYGLFQDHVGGAGGSTHGEARRYLDPRLSIAHAAQRFKGARSAADAYGVQRPANREDYIAKVSAALGGKPSGLNAPVSGGELGASSGAAPAPAGGGDAGRDFALNLVFRRSPFLRQMIGVADAKRQQAAALAAATAPAADTGGGGAPSGAAPYAAPDSTGGKAPGKRPNERWVDYLQRMGRTKFGLENDPGDSQTTGGRHTTGSEHYDGRAVDFGDARNSRAQLNAWLQWARSQGFDAIDEGNHIHVSAPGSGT